MEEEKDEEKEYNPVGDFVKGILLGCFILFCVFLFSIFFLFPLLGNNFWIMMALVIAIQITLGIIAWIRWKRKFMALGLFLLLPIVAFIFYSICGSFY